MAKTPDNLTPSAQNELMKEIIRLESLMESLEQEIKESRNRGRTAANKRDKIKDKTKKEYTTFSDEIKKEIKLQGTKRDKIDEITAILRELNGKSMDVGNVSRSKNLPPKSTPEELKKAKKALEKKNAEDLAKKEKEEALVLLRRLEKGDATLNTEQKELAFKYEDELVPQIEEEIKKEKSEAKKKKDIRTKIAEALNKEGEVEFSTAEKIHLMKDGEVEEIQKISVQLNKEHVDKVQKEEKEKQDKIQKEEDAKKAALEQEKEKQDAINAIVDILAIDAKITNPDQEKFDTENKAEIDTKVTKAKDEILNIKKNSVIEKLSEKSTLTADEQKVYDANKTELDINVVDTLKTKLAAVRVANDFGLIAKYEDLIRARIETVKNAKDNYKPLADSLNRLQNDTRYQNLKSRNDLSQSEKDLLAEYQREEAQINTGIDNLGPAGRHYVNLDINRSNLAKATQEFKSTFKSKFFGAKVLGVFAGMFGSKWSAVKETDKTAAAQKKVSSMQASYDEVRRSLLNIQMDEEYKVRGVFGQTKEQMVGDQTLQNFINNITEDLVIEERHKLDALNREMEGTVRGSAMQRFGRWYSKDFMNFGPFKGSEKTVARNVAKRVISGLVFGTVLLPFVGAGAGLGTYFGYRALRAGFSATVGESFAAGLAHSVGGKLTANNRFEKFEKKTKEELQPMIDKVRAEMLGRITAGEKPVVNPTLMQYINTEEIKANNNYLKRESNLRRGEMLTRIIAGGATAYGMTQLIPNPTTINPTPIQTSDPNPIVVPKPDNFSEPRVVIDTDHANHGDGMRAPIENHLNDSAVSTDDSLNLEEETGPKVQPDPINTGGNIEDPGNTVISADVIDQKIALYKQFENPGSEGDFYQSRGLDVMGKELGTRGQITQVNDGTISYYAKGYEHLSRGNGDWRPLEDASFYKEYHLAHDNYLDAQDQIKNLEAEKIKLKIDALQDKNPNTGSVEDNIDNSPKATTGNIETKIIHETPEQHTDKLVDEIYGHDTAMGHESGIDSDEWQSVKDMPARKFLRNYRTNIDDTYANTKYDIPEQNKFADTILEKSEKYNIKPRAGGLFSKAETLEHFVDRLSKAELENKTQSSK